MSMLKNQLKGKLTEEELKLIPRSFDTIGTIVLFTNFPDELKDKQKLIGETIINNIKNVKTVAIKTKEYSGKYRLQKVKIIAGKKTKETTHKENGTILKLNIENCYFSPRTGSERLRVAKKIKKDESILVMFSGIAPFPLTIEKNSNPKEIYAIEANPVAHKYAIENLELNKSKRIKLFKGDVSKVLKKIRKKFDRILMPLPKSAEEFLPLAIKKLNPKGVIHFYDFSQEKDFPQHSLNKIKTHCKKFKIIDKVICGHYAPFTYRVCIEFQPL